MNNQGGNLKQFEELSKIFSLIPLDGKKPIETNWSQWCETKRPFKSDDFKNNNAGIACGPASGVIVIDVDNQHTFNKIADQKGWQINPTLLHETGARKFHFVYGYPQNGKRYGNKARKEWGFDIRGIGGQVVAPGSIHPDTGKPYTVRRDLPIAPAPQWLLDLYADEKPEGIKSQPSTTWNGELDSLPISLGTKKLIKDGEKEGGRSEAIFSVLISLLKANIPQSDIFHIFESYPIGEKYREKGQTKEKWLQQEIGRAKNKLPQRENIATGMSLEDLEKEFEEEVKWLWREHIPEGLPSMIGGREGSGKTTFALLAAKEIIEKSPTGIVAWLATEGAIVDTKAKIKELGLSTKRFQVIKGPRGNYRFNLRIRNDLDAISNYLDQLGEPLLMLVVDSLRGSTDLNVNDDLIRNPIMNLNAIVCDKHRAACAWIHHCNRKETKDKVLRIAGNLAIVAAMRHLLFVEGRGSCARLISEEKTNIRRSPDLRMIKVDDRYILHQSEKDTEETQSARAEEMLSSLFRKSDRYSAKEIEEQAEKAGISIHTVRRAKSNLGIKVAKEADGWVWKWHINQEITQEIMTP